MGWVGFGVGVWGGGAAPPARDRRPSLYWFGFGWVYAAATTFGLGGGGGFMWCPSVSGGAARHTRTRAHRARTHTRMLIHVRGGACAKKGAGTQFYILPLFFDINTHARRHIHRVF